MKNTKPIVKQAWKPGNVLSPVPVVLVTCGGTPTWRPNIITVAWTGSICSDPPMLSISLRPQRYSFDIIRETGEFVVNLPSCRHAKAVDWCGMVSGAKVDKFAETGLTPAPALKTSAPIILECPVNIECRVKTVLPLGTHDLLLAEVLAVQVTADLMDEKGRFRVEKAEFMAYGIGEYFALGESLGRFGFSVRKKKTKRGK